MKLPLLVCLCLLGAGVAFALPPVFQENLDLCGLAKVQRIHGLSEKNIHETITEETLPDGRKLEIAVRLPFRGAKLPEKVNGVVFVAPYVNERFRTVRSPLANALVLRLGCAVVSISAEKRRPGDDPFLTSYVYPTGGYHAAVERAILRVKAERGSEETPVFTLGYSIGGVMALYLAQSPALKVRGAVALELAQDRDIAPGILRGACPTLILNPEDSPWNAVAARLHGEAVEAGLPAAFVITRPIVSMDERATYYRKAGGRYSNELAFCFIRDAIAASERGAWPAEWRERKVAISTPAERWEESVLSSSEDFLTLYQLATHNHVEILDGGESAYTAAHPLRSECAVLVIKKGSWLYQDQARLAALAVQRGRAVAICAAPDGLAAAALIERQTARLRAVAGEAPVILALAEDDDSEWLRSISEACSGARLVWLRRGTAFSTPAPDVLVGVAVLSARADYEPALDVSTILSAEPTWIVPADFERLLDGLDRNKNAETAEKLKP